MEHSNSEQNLQIEQLLVQLENERVARVRLEKKLAKIQDTLYQAQAEYEQKILQRNLELKLLHELSRKVDTSLSYYDLFELILQHLLWIFPGDVSGGILLEDPVYNLFIKSHHFLENSAQQTIQNKLFDCLKTIQDLPTKSRPFCLHNLSNYESIPNTIIIEISSFLFMPIITDYEGRKQTLGVLFIGKEQEYNFTEDQQQFLQEIVTQVSIAIQQLQIFFSAEKSRIENEKIRQTLDKERELNNLKSRFIRTISHEYRTPLTIISLASQLLENQYTNLTDNQRLICLQRIRTATVHMTNLVNDVLLINDLEAGMIKVKPTTFELISFCRQLVEELKSVSNFCPIQFIAQETNKIVNLDHQLVRQILIHLLSNAIKYSPEGGNIIFEVIFGDHEVSFRIQDHGVGIPAQDQTRLFDFFHRGSNTTVLLGTGLGLTIVKKCLDLQDGEILFETRIGEGTTFIVKLPL